MRTEALGRSEWPAWSGTGQDLRELAEALREQAVARRRTLEEGRDAAVAHDPDAAAPASRSSQDEWRVIVRTKEREFDLRREGPAEEVLSEIGLSAGGEVKSIQMLVMGDGGEASGPLIQLVMSASKGVLLEVRSDNKAFVRGALAVIGDHIARRVPPGSKLLVASAATREGALNIAGPVLLGGVAGLLVFLFPSDEAWWNVAWYFPVIFIGLFALIAGWLALGRLSRLEIRAGDTPPALVRRVRGVATWVAAAIVVPALVGLFVNNVS